VENNISVNYYALVIGTIIILFISWFISVKYKRYHGIARFFSFESIFILLLLNIRIWFKNPFSLHQIISWILLILSAYAVVSGYLLLKTKGKPEDNNFENTSNLVKAGIYGYIRHPLYLSLFLLGTGIVLKDPGYVQISFGIINLIAIYFTARIEEKEMIAKFGNEYMRYMKETKMFLPFIV
jgi:protein-S-isoprenylcysteine O-methyltransferase Ste14